LLENFECFNHKKDPTVNKFDFSYALIIKLASNSFVVILRNIFLADAKGLRKNCMSMKPLPKDKSYVSKSPKLQLVSFYNEKLSRKKILYIAVHHSLFGGLLMKKKTFLKLYIDF